MRQFIFRRFLEWLVVWPAIAVATPQLAGFPDHHKPIPEKKLERPALHEKVDDKAFGVSILRVTEAAQVIGVSRLRHYYAKRAPFNADRSLAIMMASDGHHWLYDTKKWKPLSKVPVFSPRAEVHWHPTRPDIALAIDAGKDDKLTQVEWLNVRSGKRKPILDLRKEGFIHASGMEEGNPDRDMRYYAVAGEYKGGKTAIAVVDLKKGKLVAKRTVPDKWVNDWVSVSPSGKYVVAMGKKRSRVFDRKLKLLHKLPAGSHGHGDLCLAKDGREAMVFDGADLTLNGKRNINITWLDSGKTEIGVRIGWSATPHVSCRNLELPGWALVSTQGRGRKSDYPNLNGEIFWLKLDGSGEIRRIAHHRSNRDKGGYFAEQHATSDPTGRWIMFASNWYGKEVASYLIELPVD